MLMPSLEPNPRGEMRTRQRMLYRYEKASLDSAPDSGAVEHSADRGMDGHAGDDRCVEVSRWEHEGRRSWDLLLLFRSFETSQPTATV